MSQKAPHRARERAASNRRKKQAEIKKAKKTSRTSARTKREGK